MSNAIVSPLFLDAEEFRRQLYVEQKRAQRSGTSFVLVMLDAPAALTSVTARQRLLEELRRSVRDTDVCGWHTGQTTVGIIFTETGLGEEASIGPALVNDIQARLKGVLSAEECEGLRLGFSVFSGL